MLNVFIGSSSEARTRDITPQLVQQLSGGFSVTPWYDAFQAGDYTLETLLEQAAHVDLAAFVFSNDDYRVSRGTPDGVTRDNVILEYGVFTASLGRKRVAIIQEDGVQLPVDVNGLTVARFRADRNSGQNADLERAARRLTERWQGLGPKDNGGKSRGFADGGLGFAKTLDKAQGRLHTVADRLARYVVRGERAREPLVFDSKPSCVSTYAEALDLVQQRFWTTTFLSSGFWTSNNADVIEANAQMMQRLAPDGDVRRIFLLTRPLRDEIQVAKNQRVHLRQSKRFDELRRLNIAFQNMKESVCRQLQTGCKLKVAFDAIEAHEQLPEEMHFDPTDSEVAIYDNVRVDVFEGGRTGRINGVQCYTPAIHTFPSYLKKTEDYFDHLWKSGVDIGDVIKQLEQAHASAAARIDYESNWLASYEFSLGPEDEALKTVEIKRVEEVLRTLEKWGTLTRCLDIGTCTARYPIYLTQALNATGTIVGIDEDMDCVRFAKANVQRLLPAEARIRFSQVDFTAADVDLKGPFDLITCMLGTLSHFGRDRSLNAPYADLLQQSLERMTSLLGPDGLLVLGTWSEFACAHGRMLGIYRESERHRLAEWTPTLAELRQRLSLAGLSIIEQAHPDVRLDLTVCRARTPGVL